jgi:GTP cyclohydrolase I
MTIRGIKSIGAKTNTSIMLGDIDKDEAIRLLEMDKTLE